MRLSVSMPRAHSPSFDTTGSARVQNSPSCFQLNANSSRTGPMSMFFSNTENSRISTGPSHDEMHVAIAAPCTPSSGRPNAPKIRP